MTLSRFLLLALCASLGLACHRGADPRTPVLQGADTKPPALLGGLPESTKPCQEPKLWPLSMRSQKYPAIVHYRAAEEESEARAVLMALEKGWAFHVERMGQSPVLDDRGTCGPDGAFDAFVWRGHRSCLVDVIGPNSDTPWDDRMGFMIMDPWGPYGGPELEETVVHEMAHASQASNDWYETPIAFEMTAVFLDQVAADRYIKVYLNDFQSRPDWALLHDDKYETWYLYGSSLYLMFLRDRYFNGDARFVAEMWNKARNPPGAETDQSKNDPDIADVLDGMIKVRGGEGFLSSIPEFARVRWYTGSRVDDKHFRHFTHGLENLKKAELTIGTRATGPGTVAVTPGPEMTGTSYIELTAPPAQKSLTVALRTKSVPGVRFVVQAVPGVDGKSDGETLDLSRGPRTVTMAPDGKRTLIVTALPTGPWDPDLPAPERYPFELDVTAN